MTDSKYYEQFSANKFDNWNEVDKFLGTKGIKNPNSPILV